MSTDADDTGGPGEPRNIRDYPRITLTIRAQTRELLDAIAAHENRSLWRIVESSIQGYFEGLSPRDRRAIENRLAGRAPYRSDTVRMEVPRWAERAVVAFVRLWTQPKDVFDDLTRRFIAGALDLPIERKKENGGNGH